MRIKYRVKKFIYMRFNENTAVIMKKKRWQRNENENRIEPKVMDKFRDISN